MSVFSYLKSLANNNKETPDKKQSGAIATEKKFNGYSAMNLLYKDNPDKILNGESLEKYESLLYDSHVASCWQQRLSGVGCMEYILNNNNQTNDAKDSITMFVENIFNHLDIKQIKNDIMQAILYGYSPIEIYWSYVNGYVAPEQIIGKPPYWFVFDNNNQLRFKTKMNLSGELLPNGKFLLARNSPNYNNPYGTSILAKCYYPVIYKKGAMKLWSELIEKYGLPYLNAQILNADEDLLNKVLAGLENVKQSGIIVTDMDTKVDLLGSNNASTESLFKSFIELQNNEISKAILSQTLTTDAGASGSYAMARVHFDVRTDIVNSDKLLVESIFNKLIQWIVDYNFPNVAQYPRFELYNVAQVDKGLAEVVEILERRGTMSFTKQFYINNFGYKEGDFIITEKTDVKPLGAPAPMNEPLQFDDTTRTDTKTQTLSKPAFTSAKENVSNLMVNDTQKHFDSMVDKVIEFVDEGLSYDEIENRIGNLFKESDTTEIENAIAKAITVFNTAGQLK